MPRVLLILNDILDCCMLLMFAYFGHLIAGGAEGGAPVKAVTLGGAPTFKSAFKMCTIYVKRAL